MYVKILRLSLGMAIAFSLCIAGVQAAGTKPKPPAPTPKLSCAPGSIVGTFNLSAPTGHSSDTWACGFGPQGPDGAELSLGFTGLSPRPVIVKVSVPKGPTTYRCSDSISGRNVRVGYQPIGEPEYYAEGDLGDCTISVSRVSATDFNGVIDATVVLEDSCKSDESTQLQKGECGTETQPQPNPSATRARPKITCSKKVHVHAIVTLHNNIPGI